LSGGFPRTIFRVPVALADFLTQVFQHGVSSAPNPLRPRVSLLALSDKFKRPKGWRGKKAKSSLEPRSTPPKCSTAMTGE
jgi:hypothetical protein